MGGCWTKKEDEGSKSKIKLVPGIYSVYVREQTWKKKLTTLISMFFCIQ